MRAKRSVRYDSGWDGARGGPGDNEIRIPELDTTSRVEPVRRMDTWPQEFG